MASAGCAHLPFGRKPSDTEKRLAQGGLTIDSLQFEVLRFADDYVESIANAADGAAKALKTRQAEVAALKWKGVIDHAFWRGLVLIVLLLAGSIPARLGYRALERRLGRGHARSDAPGA